ncbi:hypothetical protein QEM13_000372 [Pseudomonas putida]|nr:hypothetical protein [Pseudomonas putida]
MRRVLLILVFWASHSLAQQPVLRFSVAESWSMPLIRLEQGQPVEGILFDLMQALAREAGVRPRYHLMARLRLKQAMDNGDIDVRCYVTPQWFSERFANFVWSVPLLRQSDLLVGSPGTHRPTQVEQLVQQPVGTVLGYSYPALAVRADRPDRPTLRRTCDTTSRVPPGHRSLSLATQAQ